MEEDKRDKELKDTVDGMLSSDYKERFRAEYDQLSIRYRKLGGMLDKWARGQLTFTPACPQSSYSMQMIAMADYMAALERRAAIEGIELEYPAGH